jgi:hypothetical protein
MRAKKNDLVLEVYCRRLSYVDAGNVWLGSMKLSASMKGKDRDSDTLQDRDRKSKRHTKSWFLLCGVGEGRGRRGSNSKHKLVFSLYS